MPGEIATHPDAGIRLRRPSGVAVLSLATLGLYTIVWYYKVNREMRDFGLRNGDRELASTNPWASVLGLIIGAFVVIPRLVTLVRTVRRLQSVERIATGTTRQARGLYAGVLASALLPLGVSARRIGELFALAGLVAFAVSATLMQRRLNAALCASRTMVSHGIDTVVSNEPTTRPALPVAPRRVRSRSTSELLERIDRQRSERTRRQQER
jgi:Domain of unknown function (DUF4234)